MLYIIFLCQKCGMIYYSLKTQKSKICIKCGHRILIRSARILSYAASSEEARYLVETYKVPESKRQEFMNAVAKSKANKPLKDKEILEEFIHYHVHEKNKGSIEEDKLFLLLNEKGLPNEWIKTELENLINQGIVIRPRKGILKFIT